MHKVVFLRNFVFFFMRGEGAISSYYFHIKFQNDQIEHDSM